MQNVEASLAIIEVGMVFSRKLNQRMTLSSVHLV